MKMNVNTLKNKKYILLAAAILLSVVSGVVVYYSLHKVLPKSNSLKSTGDKAAPSDKATLLERAEQLRKAGEAALANENFDEAVSNLSGAKRLYTEAGDTQKAAEVSDLLNHAEHEAATKKEDPPIPTTTTTTEMTQP